MHKEYPNKIAHVLNGDGDVKPPRELTPAFFGCYDWHSSVHGHWLLARVVRWQPDRPIAARARRAGGEPGAEQDRRRGALFRRRGPRVVRASVRPRVAATAGRGAARMERGQRHPKDPKLGHLDGLNLSRAWMLEGISRALPAGDRRKPALDAAAAIHRERGLKSVTAEHYEGGHWLGTFAVYLTTGRGPSGPSR